MSDDIVDFIEYSPETGIFRWKVSPCRHRRVGVIAGYSHPRDGHIRIGFMGKYYMAHRLAWRIMTGEWPARLIDHRNCDPTDNRWLNLREANSVQNARNRVGRGKYPKGVVLHKDGRFQAQIGVNGKTIYLGLHDTAESAHEAYIEAAKRYFGEFARAA